MNASVTHIYICSKFYERTSNKPSMGLQSQPHWQVHELPAVLDMILISTSTVVQVSTSAMPLLSLEGKEEPPFPTNVEIVVIHVACGRSKQLVTKIPPTNVWCTVIIDSPRRAQRYVIRKHIADQFSECHHQHVQKACIGTPVSSTLNGQGCSYPTLLAVFFIQ